MRARLAAAAAGSLLIAVVIVGFALTSHPVVAGTTGVEPVRPSIYLDPGIRECQALGRLPRGADRMRILVTNVTGGSRDLHVDITDPQGRVTSGDLRPVTTGSRTIRLRPRTSVAHGVTICWSNRSQGRITLGGDLKRGRGTLKHGAQTARQPAASAAFLLPGSASWFSLTGTMADRYANSQTGLTGGWSLWLAVLCAIAAAGLGLWAVVMPREGT